MQNCEWTASSLICNLLSSLKEAQSVFFKWHPQPPPPLYNCSVISSHPVNTGCQKYLFKRACICFCLFAVYQGPRGRTGQTGVIEPSVLHLTSAVGAFFYWSITHSDMSLGALSRENTWENLCKHTELNFSVFALGLSREGLSQFKYFSTVLESIFIQSRTFNTREEKPALKKHFIGAFF